MERYATRGQPDDEKRRNDCRRREVESGHPVSAARRLKGAEPLSWDRCRGEVGFPRDGGLAERQRALKHRLRHEQSAVAPRNHARPTDEKRRDKNKHHCPHPHRRILENKIHVSCAKRTENPNLLNQYQNDTL